MDIPGKQYLGFEKLHHQFEMAGKMYLEILCICSVAQSALFFIFSFIFISKLNRQLLLKYPLAMLSNEFPFLFSSFGGDEFTVVKGGKEIVLSADQLVASIHNPFNIYCSVGVIITLLVSLSAWLLAPKLYRYFSAEADKMKMDEHVRGAMLITEDEQAKRDDGTGVLPIGKFKISAKDEVRHIMVLGMTGSGKSTVLNQHIAAIQDAGRKLISHDPKPEQVPLFYRPEQDYILNPLDKRGLGWTIYNEMKIMPDLSAIADSVIPPGKGDDRFWSSSAKDVFRGIMAYHWEKNMRTNWQTWGSVTSPISEIAAMCKATPSGQAGYSYIQDASSKQAAGVIAVMMSYVSWLEWSKDGDFCIDDWIDQPGGSSIFITSTKKLSTTLKPYISLFTDLAFKKIMSIPPHEDASRTIHVLLDELGNFQKLPSLIEAQTLMRSNRGCIEIGSQDLALLVSIYGQEGVETIVNNCGSKYLMLIGDPKAAKMCSAICGTEEYWQANTSYSMSQEDSRGGENHGRDLKQREVVMDSEIMRLQVGEGYFLQPGGNPAKILTPWTAVNERKRKHEGFIIREGLDLSTVTSKSSAISDFAAEILASPPPEELKKTALNFQAQQVVSKKPDLLDNTMML